MFSSSGQEFKFFGTTRLIQSGVYYGKFPTVPSEVVMKKSN